MWRGYEKYGQLCLIPYLIIRWVGLIQNFHLETLHWLYLLLIPNSA